MSNTVIQLKYSQATSVPPLLNIGEPAYSFTSDKLFIGNSTNHVLTIGGKYYVDLIEGATSLVVPNTIVKRDLNGEARFNRIFGDLVGSVSGNANSATQLETQRWFNFSGDIDSVSSVFNGTANANFVLELANTGVTAGEYGSTTQVPVITIDEDGRITSAQTATISSTLKVDADTGSNNLSLVTDTLSFVGGDGITTSLGPTNNVRIDIDNTVVRNSGDQVINGDITVTGNLLVSGNTVKYDVQDYVVNDPIILLANNNISNALDLGFVAHYIEDSTTKHTGLIRDVSASKWLLFQNYEPHVQETNSINPIDPSYQTANLVANITGAQIFDLIQPIAVGDGGTGSNNFTLGQMIYFDGAKLSSIANTGTAGTYGSQSVIPVITTDDYGRVSSISNTSIGIDTSQVISGILGLSRGGLGANSFTQNAVLLGNGSNTFNTVQSSTEGHVLTIDSTGIPTFTMLSGGTF